MSERRLARDRRYVDLKPDGKKKHSFSVRAFDYHMKNELMRWIETHTVGEFYLHGGLLYFDEPQDVTIFLLSKAHEKFAIKHEPIDAKCDESDASSH